MFKKTESISHLGLIVYQEDKILYTRSETSQRDQQRIALSIAKNLAKNVWKIANTIISIVLNVNYFLQSGSGVTLQWNGGTSN